MNCQQPHITLPFQYVLFYIIYKILLVLVLQLLFSINSCFLDHKQKSNKFSKCGVYVNWHWLARFDFWNVRIFSVIN